MRDGLRGGVRRALPLLGVIASVLLTTLVPARAPSPPVFGTLRPDGGEFLAGGSTVAISWNATHGTDTLGYTWVQYSTDGGASYPNLIASGNYSLGGATVPWVVPSIDTSTARVRVCVQPLDNSTMGCRASAADFTIDSQRPFVVSVSPPDGTTNIPLNAPVYVQFSEAMDQASVTYAMSPTIVLGETWPSGSLLVLTPTNAWMPCTTYTISIMSGTDLAGNPLVAAPVPNPFSFTTTCMGLPPPDLLSPVGGEDWTGGTVHAVAWNQSNPTGGPLNWELSWTTGNTWTVFASGRGNPGTQTYDWLVPTANTTTARVRVCVSDTGNASCDTSGPFTIDSSPPVLYAHYPVDGEVDVPITTALQIVFSERMNPGRTEQAFVITPTAFVFSVFWSTDGTIATFQLEALRTRTHYVWSITCGATDASAPGNVLSNCQATHDFWTEGGPAGPTLTLDAPLGGESWTGSSLHDVVFSVSNPGMDNTTTESGLPIRQDNPSDPFTASFVRPVNLTAVGGLSVNVYGRPGDDIDLYLFRDNGDAAFAPGDMIVCASTGPTSTEVCTYSQPSDGLYFIAVHGSSVPSGNSTFNMTTTISGSPLSVTVSASYRSGIGGGPIGSLAMTVPPGTTRQGRIPWTVPPVNATDVVVNVTATIPGATLTDEGVAFEIDSAPPVVLSFGPTGAQVPLDPAAFVVFSEPMALPPADPFSLSPPASWTTQWNPSRDRIDVPLSGTAPCTAYTATVGVVPDPGSSSLRDDSDPGNLLVPVSWTFTTECSPTLDLLAPDGGEDWTGGSVHDLLWVTDDGDDSTLAVDLTYSLDGGGTYPNVIARGVVVGVGPGTFPWTLPRVDSANVRVRIVATDAAGNAASDESSLSFTIDSTPPALLTSYPLDGAPGQKTTRDLWFVFTERVDRPSFEAAFGISPNPGGVTFTWSVSNLGGDVLVMGHDPFRSNTLYTVTFGTTGKDDSDPGNFVAVPIRVRFSTQPPPAVNPPVAKAVGKNQVQVGEPVTLDGSGSTGNITSYVWRIADNQGRFVGVQVGRIATHTFTDHGRYSVTLIVSDANGLTDDDTIEIAVTSNPNSGGLLLGGAALLAVALLASTEAGRTFLFSWILFPLYVRRKRNELLEHQTRGMILGYVMVHPGDTYTDIKRNLMLTNGTLTYHLKVMENEGLIRSQIRGPRKLFFPQGVRVPEDGGGLHEVQVRMYRAIAAVPGLAVKDIAGALGITSQHALYHLRGLASQGFVRLERRGISLRCYAEPGKGPSLHEETDGGNG